MTLLALVLAVAAAGCAGVAPQRSSAPARSSDCTGDALGAALRTGGYGGGNDFGSIWIWNPTSQPCILRGPVAFAARLPDGAPDPAARINGTISFPATTLPAQMTPPRHESDPSGYLFAALMGPERDDSTQPDGLCRAQDEQTPGTFTLSLGAVSVTVRNRAADPQAKGVYGCHGRVLLEDVTGPSSDGPA